MHKPRTRDRSGEICGIPCTITEDLDQPEAAFTSVMLHAVRGVHSPAKALAAFHEAKDSYGAVHTEWSDPVETQGADDEEIQSSAS